MSKELIDKIIFKLKKNQPFSVIVEELDLNTEEKMYVMNLLLNKGYTNLKEKNLFDNQNQEASHYFINTKSKTFKLCLLSDTHLGSKFDQISSLETIYNKGEKIGVDYYLHAGDFFEGFINNSHEFKRSLRHQTVDQQIEYAYNNYPHSSKPTLIINGNHEEETRRKTKVDMLEELTKLRNDIIYLNNTKSNIQMGKLRIMMMHTNTTNRSMKENIIKKDIDKYPLNATPKIVITGHTHNRSYKLYKGTHIFQVPSLMSCRDPKLYTNGPEENGVWWLDISISCKGNIERIIQEPETIHYQYKKVR